ncbi:hypothetical protein B0H21DRAFT_716122 [Amylocystis lapponica]|nr:hypothetical protein B0H21DRAFT_716122 [Amylocystis lapponica]
MVQLHLSSLKGNNSSRFFPFHGYLGLTPVRVEGIVRTKLDEDGRPIPAKTLTISVRCYESRLSRYRTTVHSSLLVDHTEVLWAKPDSAEWSDVGDLECPFRITLPRRTSGFSSANFHDYRTFWRIEAVLEHVPITSVGSRIVRYFDLALVRYDAPSHPLPSSTPPASTHALSLQTSKPRAPVVRYNISTPTVPVGPSDIVFTSLFLQPIDPSVSVRSATVVIERRIDLHHTPSSALSPPSSTSLASSIEPPSAPDLSAELPTPGSSSSHLSPILGPESPSSIRNNHDSPSTSLTTLELSANAIASSTSRLFPTSPSGTTVIAIPSLVSSHTPLLSPYLTSPVDVPERTLTMSVVSAECTGFTCDSAGTWSKTLTLQWPTSKSQSRWALGETMHSELASVRFFIKIRVSIVSPAGTEVLDLEERELTVTATNEAERRLALAKYTEQRDSAVRSKSKSPWRAHHDHDEREHGFASPPASPATTRSNPGTILPPPVPSSSRHPKADSGRSSLQAPVSSSKSTRKTCRRPHTSAGPRDKSHLPYTAQGEAGLRSHPDTSTSGHARVGSRSSALSRESGLAESMLYAFGDERDRERERRRAERAERAEKSEREHVKGTTLGIDQVRAWEEELARIEQQSRRSSANMLGSWGFGRKKRVAQRA